MTVLELYHEAVRLGLQLEAVGDKLKVTPASSCPPEFEDVLRQQKRELVAWLQAQEAHWTPDCDPWVHIARQVIDGEFDGADSCTVACLTIGLRHIRHPLCRRAFARLPRNSETPSLPPLPLYPPRRLRRQG
jgi:hypothetical protein